MQYKHGLFIFLIALSLLQSCRKDDAVNKGLNGQWKLVEIYDGYTNGGNFLWKQVSAYDSHTLEFTADGRYTKQENSTGNFRKCTGTYRLAPDSTLEIISDCSVGTEMMKITKLTSSDLIVSYSVIEGIIAYKYAAKE